MPRSMTDQMDDDVNDDLSMEKLEAEAREVQNNKVSNMTSHSSHSVLLDSNVAQKAQGKAKIKYRQD